MDVCSSPYSFSLSFLEDPGLIGKKDDLGHLKYKLNLNENLVKQFYEIIEREQKRVVASETYQ